MKLFLKIETNAELAKKKIEEKIPGITEQTGKLSEDLIAEAKLIYDNTIKEGVENACQKV